MHEKMKFFILVCVVLAMNAFCFRCGYSSAELKHTKLDLERTEQLRQASEAEARYVKSLLTRIQEADEKMDIYRADVAHLSERVRVAEEKRRMHRADNPEADQLGRCESLLREGVELAEESGQLFSRNLGYNVP